MRRPAALRRSLSAKILLLTIGFVLLGEVLIYVPSIARFRQSYLEEKIAAAHLATLSLSPQLAPALDMDMLDALLRHAGVLSIAVSSADGMLMLGEIAPPDRVVDLRDDRWTTLVPAAFDTLFHRGERLIRVIGPSPQEMGTVVDVTLPEAPMWVAMVDYSVRILNLSVLLSFLVAGLLFLGLQSMIVQPLRRITEELSAFRDRPEDGTADVPPSEREDEIGVVERALADMRQALRRALTEKTRLAALGAAMSRISHDLKNILATAVLISDRLERSDDPAVRKVAPRLVETLERAARLCTETLGYARSGPPAPSLQRVNLLELIHKVRSTLDGAGGAVRWVIEVPPDLDLLVDSDQFFRVVLNLAQNALEAMGERGGELGFASEATPTLFTLDVTDTGPGIPAKLRPHLFEPFANSSKPAGNGLGLAICRELMRAHGGEIELIDTSERGTRFRLRLPSHAALRALGPRRSTMSSLEQVARAVLPPLLIVAGLLGCAGPGLPGFDQPGLQFQVRSFYDDRATEQNWTCNQPRMRSISSAQVVEETPQRVVMNVRYYWFDEQNTIFEDNVPFAGPVFQRCNGWAERTFTFTKKTDGTLDVVAMTGPQREG